jgi:hypothetical protein
MLIRCRATVPGYEAEIWQPTGKLGSKLGLFSAETICRIPVSGRCAEIVISPQYAGAEAMFLSDG